MRIQNQLNPVKHYFGIISIVAMLFASNQMLFAQETEDSTQCKYNNTLQEMVATINKKVDTAFVYAYEKTKFVPAEGKTLLMMGQTEESITEYLANFSDQPLPGGWAAYWGIPAFSGIAESHIISPNNSQNHQMLLDKFPNAVVHSAMWMVGKWDIAKKTSKGDYDYILKQYAAWAKKANRPIYLRIGYEFDGPHNELKPKEYIKAYQHTVNVLRAEGADNIAFVWHSFAAKPFKNYKASDYYPGDDYVDWVAISVFGQAYGGTDFGMYCNGILEQAKQHKKPVMIAEANPIYGIDRDNMDAWNDWFVNFFTFIYNKNIKAVSFINEDWPTAGIEGISEWKDGRLYNNKKIANAWFIETNQEHYLKQSPDLFEQLGYEKRE